MKILSARNRKKFRDLFCLDRKNTGFGKLASGNWPLANGFVWDFEKYKSFRYLLYCKFDGTRSNACSNWLHLPETDKTNKIIRIFEETE